VVPGQPLLTVNRHGNAYHAGYGTAWAQKQMNATGGLEAAFTAHRQSLGRFLRARLRNDSDAEDILQDLWLKLSSLESGPIAEPLAYLYRMAENLVLDRRRSALRRTNRETEWVKGQIDGTIEVAIDTRPTAERILLARDHLRRIDDLLESLPERTAFAFRAVRIDGTPQQEIAATLGISLSAVEKHLQRAYRAVLGVQKEMDAESMPSDRLSHEGRNHGV
jgi:RNA polymerase sigma factor (sigma-70 family)